MQIIFAGTPEFSTPSLDALIHSQHKVIAVYTQPDRPAGRGQKLTPSAIKQLAQKHHLPVYQPATLRDTGVQQQLAHLKPDIIVVIAYGLILPIDILSVPRYGCINVHASLLPRWRGAAPIQRAILAGDTTTGVTIMQMDKGLDTGDMLNKVTCPIEAKETSASLQQKLAILGSKALLKTLEEISSGHETSTPQDSTAACYAQKIEKREARINWQLTAIELDRLIRAFNPWPMAYTYLQNQLIKIWQAEPLSQPSKFSPGTIIGSNRNGIDVATSNGILRLLQLQMPGGRCLPVADILNAKGSLFSPGSQFEDHA